MKRRSLAILMTLLLALALTGCGSKSAAGDSYMVSSAEMTAPAEAPMPEAESYWANESAEAKDAASYGGNEFRAELPEGVKMIYRASLELETTEYEKAQSDIAAVTRELGGYFEERSSNSYSSSYRSSSYTVRVPQAQFDAFLHRIGELCRVRYQSQSAEDVSERYYDVESRLETAQIKLDRLQELLTRAESMEDIITIESAISDVEYEIEALSGELRHYDALIDYATIYVQLSEVYKVTEDDAAPLTFGARMANAFREGLRDFGDGLEDFAEWLAYSWLTLLILAAIVIVIVKLARRGAKGKKLFRKKDKTVPPADPDAQK